MFEIIKSVISNGGYKLTDIQHKIKKLFLLGDLTEDQMDELIALASGGVSVEAERPENLKLIQALAEEIEALEHRVTALESGKSEDGEGNEESGGETDVTAYPVWKAWDGISKDYQHGAVVFHNGELWFSNYSGQNVWEPGTIGTEALWVKYTA